MPQRNLNFFITSYDKMLISFQLGDLVNNVLQFDFEIIYKPDAANIEADCLSRNHVLKTNKDILKDKIYLVNLGTLFES